MDGPDLGRRDTHNTYLSPTAEVGLPGPLLWVACIGSVLRQTHKVRQIAAASPLATRQAWIERAFYAYLVAGTVGTSELDSREAP